MKKSLLKTLILTIFVCVLSITFVGCASKSATTENSNTSEPIVITKDVVKTEKDAYNIYNLALNKFEMNYNNVWDNIRISTRSSQSLYYTTADGTSVVTKGDYIYWSKNNLTGSGAYSYNKNSKTVASVKYAEFKEVHFFNTLLLNHHLQESDLLSFDVDADGNYIITFSTYSLEETTKDYAIYEYTISNDHKFLSARYQNVNYATDNSHSPIEYSTYYTLEYGVVTEADVSELLAEATQALNE